MIIAFYARLDGKVEKIRMHRLDYDEVKRRAPDLWDLYQRGKEIVDRTGEYGDDACRTHHIPPPSRQLTGIDDKVR
jgi:hypothetical protein